jgi:hypothetical protein
MSHYITSATRYNIEQLTLAYIDRYEGGEPPRGQLVTFLVKNGYPPTQASTALDLLVKDGVIAVQFDGRSNNLIITRASVGGEHV